MSTIVIKRKIFLTSLLIVVSSFILNISSQDLFWKKFSEAVFWVTTPVLFFSLLLFFLKSYRYNSWLKFTKVFYSISLLLILFSSNSSSGIDFIPSGKEAMSQLLAILYSIISLFLIIFKSIQLRGRGR